MNLRQPGCPDIFAGNPNVEDIDIDPDRKGSSWLDFCDQAELIFTMPGAPKDCM